MLTLSHTRELHMQVCMESYVSPFSFQESVIDFAIIIHFDSQLI